MGTCQGKSGAELELDQEAILLQWIANLSHPDSEERRNALQKLQEQPIAFIREAGGIEPLLALLTNESADICVHALDVLKNLTRENPDNQDAIRRAGGTVLLEALLNDKIAEVRGNAAMALELLGHRVATIEVDPVHDANSKSVAIPLKEMVSLWIASLNQEDVDVRRKAVEKLLAKPAGYIREAGGIEPLVALLKAEANTTRESAMSVLEGLLCRDYGVSTPDQDAVREAGAIELLVALLASKSEDMCGKAVHMLESLARENSANKDAIREAGAIVPLLALLNNADQDVRLYAAGALSVLASANSTNKDAICDAGGVVALVHLLKDGSTLARQYAAAALASLAHNILNVPAIRATEAIPLLEALLKDKVVKVRANATIALELLGHRIAAMNPESTHNANSKLVAIPLEEVVRIIRFEDLHYNTDFAYVGKGAFSKVYKGVWKGKTVAVKEFLFQGLSEEATKELRKEAVIMQRLRHPNIMPLYGACLKLGHRSLVMPYLGGGSLRLMLGDYTKRLSWQLRWKIALGISRGISYLHGYKPPILHRDLKSPNVMLDERCVPMVADFGLSKAKTETTTEMGAEVPPFHNTHWMAVELFYGKRHTEASDIFSLGVIFWELATRKRPWSGVGSVFNIFARLKKGERNEIPENTPSSYARLIERCWAERIEERPQIDVVVEELEAHQSESAQAASAT